MKTHSRTKKYYRLTMRLKTYDSFTFTIGTIQIPFELSQFIERKLTVVYLLYTFFIIHLVLVLIQQCFNFKVNDIIWYHFISFHSRVFVNFFVHYSSQICFSFEFMKDSNANPTNCSTIHFYDWMEPGYSVTRSLSLCWNICIHRDNKQMNK